LVLPLCKYYYTNEGKQDKFNPDVTLEKVNTISKGGIRVIAIATSEVTLVDDKLPGIKSVILLMH
jgi:hypothetical protein